MPFSRSTPAIPPMNAVGVLATSAASARRAASDRDDAGEKLGVLDLTGHHGLGDAGVFEQLIQRAELAERHPVQRGRRRLRGVGQLGERSSLRAMTVTSWPAPRAASSTRNGNRPFPAIRPRRIRLFVGLEPTSFAQPAALRAGG